MQTSTAVKLARKVLLVRISLCRVEILITWRHFLFIIHRKSFVLCGYIWSKIDSIIRWWIINMHWLPSSPPPGIWMFVLPIAVTNFLFVLFCFILFFCQHLSVYRQSVTIKDHFLVCANCNDKRIQVWSVSIGLRIVKNNLGGWKTKEDKKGEEQENNCDRATNIR